MKKKRTYGKLREKLKKVAPVYSVYKRYHSMMRGEFLKDVRFAVLLFIGVRKPVAKLLKGKHPAKHYIHLEVTYDCDLKCNNCNRICGQAPSAEYLTIEQIQKFIEESTDNDVKWKKIIVSGGEPTIHPNILQILDLLIAYQMDYSHQTIIELQTNGYGEAARNVLSRVPKEITIENSTKKSSVQRFHPINLAPIDSFFYKDIDFSIGCDAVTNCGICLTPYGYYPCSIAGAIDRVFGFDLGRKKLPSVDDPMLEMLPQLCKFCGAFRFAFHTTKQLTSLSWKIALERYREKKPSLTRY